MKRKKIIGSAVTVVSAFLLFLFIAPAAYGVFHVGNVLENYSCGARRQKSYGRL